jgi:hypothetical protein
MRRPVHRLASAATAAVAVLLLVPGVAWAPWHSLSDEAFSDEALCRDGGRLILSTFEYFDESELATIPTTLTPTYDNVAFTSPPAPDAPPEPDPVPPPPDGTVVFDDVVELKYAPVNSEINFRAYSVYLEPIWAFPLEPGDLIKFDWDSTDRGDITEREFAVTDCLLDRSLDVLPGASNVINFREKKLVVAVKTSEFIDASSIDVSSIRFGPNEARPKKVRLTDVDGDGDIDMLLQFRLRDTGISCGDTTVMLQANSTGEAPYRVTDDPTRYQLYDSITTTGC